MALIPYEAVQRHTPWDTIVLSSLSSNVAYSTITTIKNLITGPIILLTLITRL